MITTEATIDFLRESRQEKMAATLVIGLMYDSIPESVARLEDLLPHMQKLEVGSRKIYGKKKEERIPIDNEIARLAQNIVEDILPWLKGLAALEAKEVAAEEVIGLA